MPFFWQRRSGSAVDTTPSEVTIQLAHLTDQLPALAQQLTQIQQLLETSPRLDPGEIRSAFARLETQIEGTPAVMADTLAEQMLRLAYRLFRGELQVTVNTGALVAGGDFLYLPIDPDEQYDLIFYHPTDPTLLGARLVLNQRYAYIDTLTNTLALHIRTTKAPPGLVESLLVLHEQSGPIFLGHRLGGQNEVAQEIAYWPYSGTRHDRDGGIQQGRYASHLIFYYLLSGGTAHTYAEEVGHDPFALSGVQVVPSEVPRTDEEESV